MRVSKDEIIAYFFQLKKDNPNITIEEVKELVLEKFQTESVTVESSSLTLPSSPPLLTKRCIKCGTNNPEVAAFCWSCGAKMLKPEEQQVSSAGKNAQGKGKENVEIGEYREGKFVCRSCGQELPAAMGENIGQNENGSANAVPKRRSYAGVICSYCEKRIEFRQQIVVCPECGDPQHSECWRANNNHCSVPNCNGYLVIDEPVQVVPAQAAADEAKCSRWNLNKLLDIWENGEPEEFADEYGYEQPEYKEKKRKCRQYKKWFLIFIILALLGACAGFAYMAFYKAAPDLGMTPAEFKQKYNKEEANLVKALNGVSVLKMGRINVQDKGKYKVFSFANERHALLGIVNSDGKLRAVLAGGRHYNANDQFMLARLWHTALGVFAAEPIVNADGLLNLEEVSRRTLLSPSIIEIESNEPHVILKPVELKNAKCGWVTTENNENCYIVICSVLDNIEKIAGGVLAIDVTATGTSEQQLEDNSAE